MKYNLPLPQDRPAVSEMLRESGDENPVAAAVVVVDWFENQDLVLKLLVGC